MESTNDMEHLQKRSRSESHSSGMKTPGKFSLRRVEPVIHRIVKVAIPYHLNILSKHRLNIEKFQRQKQWDKLNNEQINASRTVQQLKADLCELDSVRNQVQPEHLKQFERLVLPIQEETLENVRSFTELYLPTRKHAPDAFSVLQQPPTVVSPATSHPSSILLDSAEELLPTEREETVLSVEIPANSAAYKSWNALRKDLVDISDLMTSFSKLVYEQRESVNSIESNVTKADNNVQKGTRHLARAAQLQAALLPVTGALLGMALGGPVGMIVGAKMALGCAVGGSLLGFTGGKALQRRKSSRDRSSAATEVELKELLKKDIVIGSSKISS